MPPMKNCLVSSMLIVEANRKITLVRFSCENKLCNPNGSFVPSAFLFFLRYHSHQHYSSFQKVSSNFSCLLRLLFRRYVYSVNISLPCGTRDSWGHLHEEFLWCGEHPVFFVLTSWILAWLSSSPGRYYLMLNHVALSREAIEMVITCVQHFLRDPSFTQKSFFSDSVVAMLKDSLAVTESVIISEEFNPWSVFGDGCNQQVVSDLQSCQVKVVMRRKASRDKSERWTGAQSAGSPSASASAGRSGVQNPNVVEEGRVEYVAIPEPTASLSHSVRSLVIGNKMKASVSSGPRYRKHFEVVSPVTSPRK